MKRAVIRSTSEEGYRTLVVVDAVKPHLSIRDVINDALIGDIVGSEVDIRTLDVPDDAPPMPGPEQVGVAIEAIGTVLDADEHGLTAPLADALTAALEALGGGP